MGYLDLVYVCLFGNGVNGTPNAVPQSIDASTTNLMLKYTGPDTHLTPAMFDHLVHLKNLTICGNISSLAPNTFGRQWNIKQLVIRYTKLTALPNNLFQED